MASRHRTPKRETAQQNIPDSEMAWRPYVAATATALAIAALVLAVSHPGFWAVVAIAAFSVLALALSLWAWFWVWVNKHSPKLKALLVRTAPRIAAFATPLRSEEHTSELQPPYVISY